MLQDNTPFILERIFYNTRVSLRVSVIKGHFHFSIPLNPVIKVIKDFVF